MSDDTYLITLPDGNTMGPLSMKVIRQFALDGDIPRNATVNIGGQPVPVAEMIQDSEIIRNPSVHSASGAGGRMTAEMRAELAGTRASSPMALHAENSKKSG